MSRVLIVEDEAALASALGAACKRIDCDATLCASGKRALEEIARESFSLAVLDIGLPDMSGLALIEKLRAQKPSLPILVITAHGNLDNAVAAKKLGASCYLVKPLDLEQFQTTLRLFFDILLWENKKPAPGETPPLLVGASAAMQAVFIEIAHACSSDSPVLITGPTGTGKTLAARVIHANSARRAAPFVTLHCSALPEPLLESELFGHEKNAFTGAANAKTGHVERAQGGTLFLDEIGDIPPALQAKLLRFVEEKTFTRVGGREDIEIDLRLIAATNKNLREEVKAGRFREDLFYRLHVLEIAMPPLRERRDDIVALASVFLGATAPDRTVRLAPETVELLRRHDWPGNVRELRNAIDHALAVSSGGAIFPQHLPRELRERLDGAPPPDTLAPALDAWIGNKLRGGDNYDALHDALDAALLKNLLARFDGKPTILARELGMNRVTLRKKLRQYFGENEIAEEADEGERR